MADEKGSKENVMTQNTDQPRRRFARFIPGILTRAPSNIFGILIIVAGVAIALRLVNVASFALALDDQNGATPGMTRTATAQATPPADPAVSLSDENTPPLTQDDVSRAVRDTAAQLDGSAPPATPATAPAAAAASTPAAAPDAAPPAAAMPFAPTDGVEYSQSELDILQSLSKRRAELDQRERNLSESAALLKAAEQEVDRKLSELNSLKREIEELIGTQEQVEGDRITSLVKIYEAMKPKEAATIFNTLDEDVLLSVVSRMNERRLSPILASMDPEKARMVTIRLAEQRQLPEAVDTSADSGPETTETPFLNLPDSPVDDTATP